MKNLPLLLVLFICNTVVFAQDITFTVLNSKTKEPIQNVHVTKGKTVFISNEKGKITVPKVKNETLFFSHVRFLDKKIDYKKGMDATIYLVEKNEKLSEVVVLNKKRERLSFKTLPKLEKGIHDFASVVYNNKIYVFGGDASVVKKGLMQAYRLSENDVEFDINDFFYNVRRNASFLTYNDKIFVFDLGYKSWSVIDAPILKRAYHKGVLIDKKVYLLGGKRISKSQEREYLVDEIEVFDLVTNTFEKTLDNKQNGVNQGVEKIDESIVMLGGSVKTLKKGKKRYSRNVALYDTKRDKWFAIGMLPDPKETECIRVKDKLYLIGGDKNNALNTITSFNLKNGKWKIEKILPQKIKKPAIQKKGDDIYIFDAYNFYKYNTVSNLIQQYEIDIPYKGSDMLISENKLYILGGFIEQDLERIPSSKMFSIDLEELNNTDFNTY